MCCSLETCSSCPYDGGAYPVYRSTPIQNPPKTLLFLSPLLPHILTSLPSAWSSEFFLTFGVLSTYLVFVLLFFTIFGDSAWPLILCGVLIMIGIQSPILIPNGSVHDWLEQYVCIPSPAARETNNHPSVTTTHKPLPFGQLVEAHRPRFLFGSHLKRPASSSTLLFEFLVFLVLVVSPY